MPTELPRITTLFVASLVALVVTAASCGGRIEDDAGGGGSAPATPAAGTNAPASQPASEGCARACDRIEACAPGVQPRTTCITSCDDGFRGEQSRSYARCIGGLSCAEIERGMFMDYGPIGACYVRAGGR